MAYRRIDAIEIEKEIKLEYNRKHKKYQTHIAVEKKRMA